MFIEYHRQEQGKIMFLKEASLFYLFHLIYKNN